MSVDAATSAGVEVHAAVAPDAALPAAEAEAASTPLQPPLDCVCSVTRAAAAESSALGISQTVNQQQATSTK